MSIDEFKPLCCDVHDNEELAIAVCIKHQNLLYRVCESDKASPSCDIKPLDKITDDKIQTVVEYLRIKQSVCKTKLHLTENEKKVEDLKNELSNKISEHYERLKRHLKELKIQSLTSLESMTGDILDKLKNKKSSLNSLEAEVNSYLEKLSEDEDKDVADSKAQLKTIASNVKDVPEESYIPQGIYLYNTDLDNALLKFKNGLGKVQLVDLDGYEYIEMVNRCSCNDPLVFASEESNRNGKQNEPHTAKKPQSTLSTIKPCATGANQTISEHSSESTNDICSNDNGYTSTQHHQTHGFISTEKKADSGTDKVNTEASISESSVESSDITSHTKHEHDLKAYEKVELHASKCIKPKQLINRTIPVTGLKPRRLIWKFSKVVFLGESHIALFSESESALIVVDLDGSVQCQKTVSDKISGIVATSSNQLAVGLKKKPKIKLLKFINKGLKKERNFHFCLKEKMVNITGFDYDEQRSKFAISTPSELVILGADGKRVITVYVPTAISRSPDLVTSYNFKEDCVYVLNTENKTLKSFSYKTLTEIWAKRIKKQDFSAQDMCFYSDKLYVSGKNCIAVFTAKDGAVINTISTSDLLEDCLGVCAFDDVIVFSSGSDDSQKSQTLACVAS